MRIQAACVECGKLVCLCNQVGKLALNTLRGGNDSLSEGCNLNGCNWLTLGPSLPLLGLPRQTPDILGLIWGTQEAQQ